MTLNSLENIKYVMIWVPTEGWGNRQVYKLTRQGRVLGYVARSLTRGSPARAGWSYCTDGTPERPACWTRVGPGSTRADAADRLVSTISPSASWLI